MIFSTLSEVPGFRTVKSYGICAASVRPMTGIMHGSEGGPKKYAADVIGEMMEQAQSWGANAVINIQFAPYAWSTAAIFFGYGEAVTLTEHDKP